MSRDFLPDDLGEPVDGSPFTRQYDVDELAAAEAEGRIETHYTHGRSPVEEREIRVLDICSGPGGVGVALRGLFNQPNMDGWFLGVDIEDYAETYPGRFVQKDLRELTLEFLGLEEKVDLVWISFPCLAYTRLSYVHHDDPTEVHPTIPEYGVREVCDRLGHEYVIENVETCHDLIEDQTIRVNGRPFGRPLNYPRKFETSFHDQFQLPDNEYTGPIRDEDDLVATATANREELAEAKMLPEARDWAEQEVRSAIPPQYVAFVLSHCPTLPGIHPPGGVEDYYKIAREPDQTSLWGFGDS